MHDLYTRTAVRGKAAAIFPQLSDGVGCAVGFDAHGIDVGRMVEIRQDVLGAAVRLPPDGEVTPDVYAAPLSALCADAARRGGASWPSNPVDAGGGDSRKGSLRTFEIGDELVDRGGSRQTRQCLASHDAETWHWLNRHGLCDVSGSAALYVSSRRLPAKTRGE